MNDTLIQQLEKTLSSKKDRLDNLFDEITSLEDEIAELKAEIADLKKGIEAKNLPTNFYLQGYKLKTIDGLVTLVNKYNEAITAWYYEPSLTDLFEAAEKYVSK